MKKGYSLIELIMTLAVSIILLSVGVARYNSYASNLAFTSNAQDISDCIQNAQQVAVTGGVAGKSYRYIAADIRDTGGSVTCDVYGYPSTSALPLTKSGSDVSLANTVTEVGLKLAKPTGSVTLANCLNQFDGSSGHTVFRIIFGSYERGVPLDVTYDGSNTGITAANPTKGQGFTSCFALENFTTNYHAEISIGQRGTPIGVSGPITSF
jgi:Tfp pilus assembly protein FimT